jgi:hypothetical protein
MGADQDQAFGVGKSARAAYDSIREERLYEYGHGGYSGTFAEEYSLVLIGTLPARVTSRDFALAADRYGDFVADGYWTEYVPNGEKYGFAYDSKKRRRDPRPNALKTPEWARKLKAWYGTVNDKWEPTAGIELNKQETVSVKAAQRMKGTQAKAFYFQGLCAS